MVRSAGSGLRHFTAATTLKVKLPFVPRRKNRTAPARHITPRGKVVILWARVMPRRYASRRATLPALLVSPTDVESRHRVPFREACFARAYPRDSLRPPGRGGGLETPG